jgi:hypothetical protein
MRIPAALAATFVVSGCYSVRYEYLDFSGDNLEIAELARPNTHGLDVGKGKIPFRYALDLPDASLTVAPDPNHPCGLVIESSVPILTVGLRQFSNATNSTISRQVSPGSPEAEVYWDCGGPTHAGETIEIRVELENRREPILLSGVVVRWGRTYRTSDL